MCQLYYAFTESSILLTIPLLIDMICLIVYLDSLLASRSYNINSNIQSGGENGKIQIQQPL